MSIFIFDLDGTVANLEHRLHFIHQDKPDWDSFYSGCCNDSPIVEVIQVMDSLRALGNEIWHFTGRTEAHRKASEEWLYNHTHYAGEPLVMRQNGDFRGDDIVKQEMLDNMLIIDREAIVAVFDDRQRVVDMWRRNNIRCFQVAKGNF